MLHYLANPHRFLNFARIIIPVSTALAICAFMFGLWQALIISPSVPGQGGEIVRILYVHVPAAASAMAGYCALSIVSLASFIWRHPLAAIAARAIAIPGAAMTLAAMLTGALWGKPTWGTYWQWDGRMTSVLILFFIYIAYISLWSFISDKKRAARLAAILAMVGVINIPIIKFSVDWWHSLHQGATLLMPGAPGLPAPLLIPLLAMLCAYFSLYICLVCLDIRYQLKQQTVRHKTQLRTQAHLERL